MKLPTVALVGRPNVGKSSIFNRIVGRKISIIEDTPGVTRDRIYQIAKYKNLRFNLIDTGGIDLSEDKFNEDIKMQAEIAMDEADVIVFVVDGIEGINSNDIVVRDLLYKSNKKVIVAINKIDAKAAKENVYDFYELGFDKYIEISAEHGTGFDKLLNEITKDFPEQEPEIDDGRIKFSVIGRPNVGKSSLVNAILREERVLVSDESGTTRDSIDTVFNYDHEEYVVIDTAGLRKKGKIYESVEKYSLIRTMKSIERSDVCVIVINAAEGVIEHDKHIASYALEAGKPIVLVVNKWDLMKDADMKKYTEELRGEFQFLSYVPIVFLSALTNSRIHLLMPEIIKVYNNSRKTIKTSIINNVIRDAYDLNPAPSYKGKRLKIYYVVQVGVAPIRFNLFVNDKGLVHFSYLRYLENKIRESIDLEGTPIELNFKNKGEKDI
ncbi:MAG: ribosome biogenesis GTPase Der [Bacilli bacterium]|nr:ribosome biogenesis GTPase Der [Bacilli bacterium]